MSGLRHVVTWPRAAFHVDGKHVVVERGENVPAGVDERVLADLRIQGAIALAGPPEKASTPQEPPPAPTGLPAKGDKRPLWDAYATTLGIDPAEHPLKPGLIEAVTAAHEQAAAEALAAAEADRVEAERLAAQGEGD